MGDDHTCVDLARLQSIDQKTVLTALKGRHEHGEVYTHAASVLIAVNPYRTLQGMYSKERLTKFRNSVHLADEPPHIFGLAAKAHRSMISEGCNQAVVINGESGAGKTESAKFVMDYLRVVSNATEEIEQGIISSQPLTEYFGCAKMLRNDNSSRFGKFIKLMFDNSAKIHGAEVDTFLLEKQRVTHVGQGERNFHVFYNLLRGCASVELKALRLPSADPSSYAYLRDGYLQPEPNDTAGLKDIKAALSHQGINEAAQADWWACIAAILILGNVQFEPVPGSLSEAAKVAAEGMPLLADVEAVLKLEAGSLERVLTKRTVKAGSKWVEADIKYTQANDFRDALSRAIFSRLFDLLMKTINAHLATAGAQESKDSRIIGVVDIFGFEVYTTNSLEQLCINFANEKLQQLFTSAVFVETLSAYKSEGIECKGFTYFDNADTISLFEMPTDGLWDLLFDECLIPRGSDEGFSDKLHAARRKVEPPPKKTAMPSLSFAMGGKKEKPPKLLQKLSKFAKEGEGFIIHHFAGEVPYQTAGWLDKNKDPLNGDVVALMQESGNSTLAGLFTIIMPTMNKGTRMTSNKFKGVVDTFRAQLGNLCARLQESQCHFVRCFKANDHKMPNQWEEAVVTRQLHAVGVLDALRVSRSKYPDWMSFQEFINTFASLVGPLLDDKKAFEAMPEREKCQLMLQKLNLPADQYELGKTRIFFALGALDALKSRRTVAIASVVVMLQSANRARQARKRAGALRSTRLAAQAAMEKLTKESTTAEIEQLRLAIEHALTVGVGMSEQGAGSLKAANARLVLLKQAAAEKEECSKVIHGSLSNPDLAAASAAVEKSKAKIKAYDDLHVWSKDDAVEWARLLSRAEDHLKALEEEARLRAEEEARLAAIAEAERAEEERLLEEQRLLRQSRMIQATKDEDEALEAEKRRAEEVARAAEKAAKQKAREAEKRRLKDLEDKLEAEDEALRERARHKIRSLGLRFKSRYQMDDVIEYAMYLGFDLDDYEDIELLWISDEGLVVDDPPNWVPKLTKDEEKYYENTVTGQVMWHHPHDYTYQQKFLDYKKNGGPIPAWWTEKRKTQDMEFQSHDGKIKLKKRRSSVTGGNVLEKPEEEPEE